MQIVYANKLVWTGLQLLKLQKIGGKNTHNKASHFVVAA